MQIRRIAESVENSCLSMNRALSVEEIQDLVENQIMAHGAFEVAKNYITYRYTRIAGRAPAHEGRDPPLPAPDDEGGGGQRIEIRTPPSTPSSATIWRVSGRRT